MTGRDDFNQIVTQWLDERAGPQGADYLDEILDRTTGTRQRPAWSSLERFISVPTMPSFAPSPRLAWALLLIAVVVALLAAALFVGSTPPMPPPFGPAHNGVIAYGAADGDIYAYDAGAAASRPLVTGPTHDETPDFSPDGTHFVFAREAAVDDTWYLMVADADGSHVRPLSGVIYPAKNGWSPDSKHVAVADSLPAVDKITIYSLDGSPPIDLPVEIEITDLQWRSPTELVFVGHWGTTHGLYVVGIDGSPARPILPESDSDGHWLQAVVSPDGSKVSYTKWVDGPTIHVVDIATGTDRALAYEGFNEGDGWPTAWSPDATKFVFSRWNVAENVNHLAVGSVDGGPVIELGPAYPDGTDGAVGLFSPDGTKIVARYGQDPNATWLLDPAGGPGERILTDVPFVVSWQRTGR